MLYNDFQGLKLSALGFGAMRLPLDAQGKIDQAELDRMVDAACVYTNTSTAWTDGAQFGLGAEIGISTQKMHARGPMALEELTTYKWIIKGNGQVRS